MNLEHLRTPIQSTHFIEKINETLSRLDDQCLNTCSPFHFLHRRLVSRLLQNPFEKKQNIKARKYCYFEYLLYLLSEKKNHFGSRFTKSKKPNVNVNVQNPVEKKPTSFAFT